MMRLCNEMEPDSVNETPTFNFAAATADGDIGNRPRGLDYYRQELLAKRGQAGCARRNWCIAEQIS